MSEIDEQYRSEPEYEAEQLLCEESYEPDDNFPGSFFRVPGTPVPGRTGWSLR